MIPITPKATPAPATCVNENTLYMAKTSKLSTKYCAFIRYSGGVTPLNTTAPIAAYAAASVQRVAFDLDAQTHNTAQQGSMVPRRQSISFRGMKWECGKADPIREAKNHSRPRDCNAESALRDATGKLGRQQGTSYPQARRPAMRNATILSGVTGIWRKHMTKKITAITAPAQTATSTTVLSVLAAGILGLGIITVAGHVQASTLHDAAHDVRHTTGFPCH